MQTNPQAVTRAYRAVCFDLDGTLLPMDIDEFMKAYLTSIAGFVASRGIDPERFMRAFKVGTRAMATHVDGKTNEEAYWEAFNAEYAAQGADASACDEARAVAGAFYEEAFAEVGAGFTGHPSVPRILSKLKEKGYPLLLTTMPMFPRRAVEHRLSWAGADASAFARITTYSNSRSVKPRQSYFAENLAAMGLSGRDVLMIGNNTQEDLAFMGLGADAYLVTNWILDPVGFDLSAVKHGSIEELEAWVEMLPACESPAHGIEAGEVSVEATRAALAANVPGSESAEAEAEGAAVAGGVLDGYIERPAASAADGAAAPVGLSADEARESSVGGIAATVDTAATADAVATRKGER